MLAVRNAVLACLVLAACDGNPFEGGPPAPDPVPGFTSVSTLPGTTAPTPTGNITRVEDFEKGPDGVKEIGNGYAQGFVYNAANDTFTVDNLAFDGGNVYTRSTVMPNVPNSSVPVYQAALTFADAQTGAQIDQFSYRALYGTSRTGRSHFAIVRTGSYASYGFGGFMYSRTGGVTIPTTGQAQYTGKVTGLRDFDGQGGLLVTSSDMELNIDFNDFNPQDALLGNGVDARIYNRQVYDLQGRNVTSALVAAVNDDKNADLTSLPELFFKIGPGVMDRNGELEGNLNSLFVDLDGIVNELESGKYYAILSGARADEVVGVLVVTGDVNSVTWRETGGFILYRP